MLKPGGICALSTWKTLGWIPYFRVAIDTIPGAPKFPETEVFMTSLGKGDWHRAAYAEHELRRHGFQNIELEVKAFVFPIESPAAFAELFSAAVMQFTLKFWNEEERDKYGDLVKPALRQHLSEKFGEGNVVEFLMTSILASACKPID